jgi:hypothetical protein
MVTGVTTLSSQMRRLPAAVVIALALVAAGCNSSSSGTAEFEGEQQAVADVVEKLQSAGETGDAKEICEEVLAKSLADQIKAAGSTCEQELDKAIKDADDFDLEVESVTVNGNTATARVKGQDRGEDRVRTFEFEKEGSNWRATNLGA